MVPSIYVTPKEYSYTNYNLMKLFPTSHYGRAQPQRWVETNSMSFSLNRAISSSLSKSRTDELLPLYSGR